MRLPLLLSAVLAAASALPAAQAQAGTPSRGDLAPVVLGESSGKQVLLSDYRGKVVVIVFWRAACAPCKDQMAAFEDLNKQYAPMGLQVIGVDLGDSARDYGSLLRKVRRPTMVMAHDPGTTVGDAWGVLMLPNMWLVDVDGRILAHHEGYVGSELQGILDEARQVAIARHGTAAPMPASPASPALPPPGGAPR